MAGRSRMTGDCHVRICEVLGVKFPRSTRPNRDKQFSGSVPSISPIHQTIGDWFFPFTWTIMLAIRVTG